VDSRSSDTEVDRIWAPGVSGVVGGIDSFAQRAVARVANAVIGVCGGIDDKYRRARACGYAQNAREPEYTSKHMHLLSPFPGEAGREESQVLDWRRLTGFTQLRFYKAAQCV
jgi:hypothetical protein